MSASLVSTVLVSAVLVATVLNAPFAFAQGDAPPPPPPAPAPPAPAPPAPAPPAPPAPPSPAPPPAPPPNNAPVVGTKALTTDEDNQLTGTFEASDIDGDDLTFRIRAAPTKVKLTLVDAKKGTFTITVAPNWNGTDSFSLEVSDGKARANGRVDVTVKPVDDAPVFKPSTINATEDSNARGQVSASDIDGDKITYAIAVAPAHGVASIDASTGAISFIPQQDYAGDDEIVVAATSGSAEAPLEARVGVKVKVAAVNDAPSVQTLTVEGIEDMKLDATFGAKDVEGDAMTFKLASQPKKGRVTVVEKTGAFTFAPNKDENGNDAFTIDVSDGKLKSSGTVIVKLAPVDDAPRTSALTIAAAEDASARSQVQARDPDGDALTFSISAPPAHGTATVDAKTGAVTYTGAPDFNGDDAFSVEVTSGPSALKAVAKVTVKVAPTNDAPTTGDVSFTVDEDGKLEGTLSASDKDGDKLTYRVVAPTKRGLVAVDAAAGSFVVRPAKDAHGDDAFAFEVSDGKVKATATANLKVVAVDDPPTTSALSLASNEDVAARGRVVASDVDGDALTYAIGRAPANGMATVDAMGAVVFTPSQDFAGGDSFSVEVSAGGAKTTAEVSVKIAAVNDAPLAAAGTGAVNEDGKLDGTVTASDLDGDKITFKVAQPTKRGLIAMDAATGAYVYRPALDVHGADAFTFEASDGKARSMGMVTLSVKPVDDAPVVKALEMNGSEDAPARGKLDARDGDGDALRFALAAAPAHGSATVDPASGAIVYTPAADYWGKDELTVDVTSGPDGSALKTTAPVTIKLAPVNDAPVAQAASFNGSEDEAIEGQLAATDVEKDSVSFKLAAAPKRGSVTIDEKTGALKYRPYANLHGADSFTFDVSDGRMKSTSTVNITVAATNDAPVARAMSLTGREDTPLRATLSGSDVDGDKLTYAVAREPAQGSVSIDERSGAFSYTPAPDVHGEDTFTLSVSDGTATAEPVVKVTLASVPDAPRVKEGVVVDVREDTAWTGTLPATSPDGGALTFRLNAPNGGPARLGNVVLVDAATGAIKYTPRADVNGDDELSFEVAPAGATSAATRVKGTLKMRVVAVNDAPVSSPVEVHSSEDTTAEAPLVASDADGDKLTFAIATPPAVGRATVHNGHTLRYEPPKDHTGDVTLDVVARDAAGATSTPVKVTVHVKPVNDPPLLVNLDMGQRAEDTPAEGAVIWSDVDDARLAFKVLKKPGRGTVDLIDATTGRFRYIPERNFSGPDSFVLAATDAGNAEGKALVRVIVTSVDDPPVASPAQASMPRVGRFRGKLGGYDPEGSTITYAIERGPAFGRVELLDAQTGEYVFITDGTGTGNTFFRFTVNDGKLTSAPSRVDITVR